MRHAFSVLLAAMAICAAQTSPAQEDKGRSANDTAGFRLSVEAPYYIGHNKTVAVIRGLERRALQPMPPRIWNGVSMLSEQQLRSLETEFSRPAVQIQHGYEQLQIGALKKVEEFATQSAPEIGVQAIATLFWGDTLVVRPKTGTAAASSATPTIVTIERSIGGSGVASSLAYYRAASSTYVNGREVPQLDYVLAKDPGGTDEVIGASVVRYELAVPVGQRFRLEALLTILDGLDTDARSAGSEYIKDGSDSSSHQVTIAPNQGLCLTSASGTFKSGDCD
jgi:hypothetical protein